MTFRGLLLATGKYGCTEVRVYPAECGETNWERSLKIWELRISCFEEFWDSSLLVSLTLWDTPVLFTPPLPLPQCWHCTIRIGIRIAAESHDTMPLRRVTKHDSRVRCAFPGFLSLPSWISLVFISSLKQMPCFSGAVFSSFPRS